mmetsp:Transcript_20428/g.36633  ORF Transcript_20428/g.36633 Transcript_20428/m.36633 type:complete len:390 (+) Transcript_20428:58-1227(+)|eukprot:CAMPEP_0197653160 /NCGR_PEP_ID=MMETSP1338-20131121/34888_1 /TAXON_ID=43686 ORGANISM="Pelagodinium beii, Strain RCC1491" /NCGR_SAMPLE_ID=MMETSP1338 /ASSEMBLY_ACC=CAM_ASM_000754 /LENGTH=389 /DNA_ID=CAMNT_0043228191 /DNA_START=53 /DNA_END=1222 /DNA_ORIENTATION=+
MVYQPKNTPMSFLGEAYPLEVRKTFVHLNVDDEIEPLQIQRRSTAPAQVTRTLEDSDEESEDDMLESSDVCPPKLLGKLGAEDEGAQPPEPGALCRTTTYDAWEAQVPPEPGMLERTRTYDVWEDGGVAAQSEQGSWETQAMGHCSVGEVMQPVMARGTELSHVVLPINLVPFFVPSPGMFGAAFQPIAMVGQQSSDFSSSPTQPAGFALRPEEVLPPNGADVSSDEHFWALPLAPQPQKLFRSYIVSSGVDRAYWTVEAGKLKSNSRVSVSPALTMSCPGTAEKLEMKMVIHPSSGASFKSSGGKGFVQIKCESNPDHYQSTQFTFRIGISSGRGDAKWQEMRGPFSWNFQENVICGLPEDQRDWNFAEVVDAKSNTFAVCLEIIPQF